MRAIDTNVLIRLVTHDDANQVAAAELFVAGGVWVSHLVLLETIWVLASVYGLLPREIATTIGMFLDHQNLVVQDADTVAAALRQYRKRATPGFSDCLVLEVARKAGHLPLGTFDREFSKLDGTQKL